MSPPLGLSYVAGHLRRLGHQVRMIDLNVSGYNPQRLRLALKRTMPDVVGISAYTETYPNALAVAGEVKRLNSGTKVVMGGAHPSILPAETVGEQDVDFVVVGEGEETTAELLSALEKGYGVEDILGLGWKDAEGSVYVNDARPLLAADAIGWPARDLLSLEFYQTPFTVLTARGGCPYRCPFCSAAHIWVGKHRPRDPKEVVDELEMLIRDYGATHVFFADDIFTLRRGWVEDLMGEMSRLRGAITWACSTRVDRVDRGLLSDMARHGCVGVQFGVESGAQEVLDSVKGIEREAALSAVKWAVGAGIETTASFMVPFPQDTETTIRETFDFMDQLNGQGAQISMSYTTPYPGTQFYDRADELGIQILTDDWGEYDAKHLIIDTAHFTADEMTALVEQEALRRGLARIA